MAADGHLNFDTKIDESGFNKGVDKLSKLGKAGVVAVGAALAGVTAAMTAGITAGIKYNSTIEQYQTSFEVMTGSAEQAAEIVQELTEIGAKTPFEMTGLAETTQLLMNYGFTADDAIDKMMMLGDISQGNADKMNRIAMAYGQMSSAGKVQLEDIKQMIEAGFNPLQEISESTGESMESLYDRISKGTISVDEITASMERSTSAGGKYFQSMEKQSETVSGQLSTLKDNTLQLLGSLTSGISETLASDILPGINDFIGSLNEAFESGGVSAVFDELANSFYNGINSMLITARVQGPQIIQNFCDGIISALPRIIEQGSVIVQNFLRAVIVNGPVLQSAGFQIFNELASGIADQLPILIPLAAQTILTLVQSLISNLPQLIQSGYQLLIGVMQGIVNAVPILISAIPQIIEGLVSGFAKNLSTMILAGIQLIVMLVTGIIQAIPQLLASIPQIFQAFADGITSVDWGAVGQQILTAIGDGIKSIGSSLWNTVKGVLGGGGEEAAEEGKKTGTKYAEGVQSTSVNAQMAGASVAGATTTSFSTGLSSGSINASLAAYDLANGAKTGMDMAALPAGFSMTAQSAASGMSTTLALNSGVAMSAGMSLGNSAKTGLSASNMSGSYSSAGATAGASLGLSLTGQTGTVSAAANKVSKSASGVDLSAAYSNAGSDAMQSLAGSISSGTGTISSAATAAANAAIQGLSNADLPGKAKAEAGNFIKSLYNTIKSGTGLTRSAVTTVITVAKQAVNGLGSAGSAAGLQFSAGLASGIRSGKSSVSMAAREVAQAAVTAAERELDINSPSKVGERIGEMFDLGMAGGIRNNTRQVLAGIGYMTGALSRETENALVSMQHRASAITSAIGANGYSSGFGVTYNQTKPDYSGILDEWERRQRNINRERDDRPIILNDREINRARRKKGDIKI